VTTQDDKMAALLQLQRLYSLTCNAIKWLLIGIGRRCYDLFRGTAERRLSESISDKGGSDT
jgi:hypothetical protein